MDLAWTLLTVAFLVGYFLLLFQIALDVFRRPGMAAWERAGWFLATLALPVLGITLYVLVRYRPGGPGQQQ